MTLVSTGVDLVEIERFQNLDPKIKVRFFKRVFTELETSESDQSLQHMAGKFAAKEAVAKALGTGIGKIHWQDLEILNDPLGRPRLILHDAAELHARQAGWTSWTVSITHTKALAMAMVVALSEETNPIENLS